MDWRFSELLTPWESISRMLHRLKTNSTCLKTRIDLYPFLPVLLEIFDEKKNLNGNDKSKGN